MPRDLTLEFGKKVKDGCPEGEWPEDMALVLDEAPDLAASFAQQLCERARVIRSDRDCFRLTDDEVVIRIPALPRPTLEQLQKNWAAIKRIERDDSATGPVTLRLSTVLKSTETRIDGTTYERRTAKLRAEGGLLGFQHRQWLITNQDNEKEIPDPKVRAALKALIGNVYIDFSGIVVVRGDGGRCVPCADDDGKRWNGYWSNLAHDFYDGGRMAVSSK